MITLILSIMLAMSPAEDRKYMEIAHTSKGIVLYEGKKETVLQNDHGERFNTLGQALEYYEGKGWEYLAAYQITYNSSLQTNITVFLLKKKP